jgi:hypothetical protein
MEDWQRLLIVNILSHVYGGVGKTTKTWVGGKFGRLLSVIIIILKEIIQAV